MKASQKSTKEHKIINLNSRNKKINILIAKTNVLYDQYSKILLRF